MPCSRSPGGSAPRGVPAWGGLLLGGESAPRGISPGPHPRGKLGGGIRSRPTVKGEIEGDQIQAHTQGGN